MVDSTMDNPLLRIYMFYSSLLVLKMMVMSLLTVIVAYKHKVSGDEQDPALLKRQVHENVARVRRAHLNDIENVVIFFAAGFGYIMTNPSLSASLFLFTVFTICRFLHTFVYAVYVVPQPARTLCFGIGYLITGYMTFSTIRHFM